jgi:DNA modification methylase
MTDNALQKAEPAHPELHNRLLLGDSLILLDDLPADCIDLIICDGPYAATTHQWDRVGSVQEFNLAMIRRFSRILRPGGTAYLFGKQDCLDFIDYRPFLKLITRIIWYQPSRLAQGRSRYTNNYDVIAYFVKGTRPSTFNLEEIRVHQLVELEHRRRCENVPSVRNGQYGKTLFNQRGKNPGDVWGDIKQLTYKSRELISRDLLNTIQKPEKLMVRLIKASSNPGDLVLDPFLGTGTSAAVASKLGRHFLGFENNPDYLRTARERVFGDLRLNKAKATFS